jgi:hypothetical protein
MKMVFNSVDQKIGLFDGRTVKDIDGNVIYWLSDDEVFGPTTYVDSNLSSCNKGQFSLIGRYVDNQCLIDGEVFFRIEK